MTDNLEMHTPPLDLQATLGVGEAITTYNNPIDISTGSILNNVDGGQSRVVSSTHTTVTMVRLDTGAVSTVPISDLHFLYRGG